MKEHCEDIQIADIEKELERLKAIQKSPSACLFNLVAFANTSRQMDSLSAIIQKTMGQFPCRVLFIKHHKQMKEPLLRIDLVHATEKSNGGPIAGDLITIEVSCDQLKRIPFILLSHIVSDLPIHLLWGEDPAKDEVILPSIGHFCTRLIFDTDPKVDSLPAFSSQLLQTMQRYPNLEFVDINWIWITGWRDVLSQVFDSPGALQNLQRCDSIDIFYNQHEGAFSKPTYLQIAYLLGWLSSRLKWEILSYESSDSATKCLCKNGSKEFVINLIPQTHTHLYPGTIVGMDLNCEENCQYSIFPLADSAKVVVHISTNTTCQLPFMLPLPCLKKGLPYIRELFFSPISTQYQPTLQAIQQLP